MAHHQRQGESRTSGIQALLKMFRIPNSTTVPVVGEEDLAAEADEPPDDQLSPLQTSFPHKNSMYTKAPMANNQRESLLTRALMGESKTEEPSPSQQFSRGLSTASTISNGSMASTAELTSDTGVTSPARSVTSSPILPPAQATPLPEHLAFSSAGDSAATNNTEAAVEKTLGRKRCVMFACGGNIPQKPKEPVPEPQREEDPPELPKRKSMLTFVCPSRATKTTDLTEEVLKQRPGRPLVRTDSLPSAASSDKAQPENEPAHLKLPADAITRAVALPAAEDKAPATPFHEFGDQDDEPGDWINMPVDGRRRLTLTDCMKKEYAIRLIGEEAEEEAEEEEKEEERLGEGEGDDDDEDDADNEEDDFAPSDQSSDGGNESDDEDGFAESDSESEVGSDYRFWSPLRPLSRTTTATTHENINVSHIRTNNSQHQSIASSLESGPSQSLQYSAHLSKKRSRRLSPKRKMRPSTPELPDSTDFVCGTLDEDRPLEAAFISCREQKKREKHIPIPQDIDPSFPTTDSEDNDEDQDDEAEDDHLWLKDQLDGFDDEGTRSRRKLSSTMLPPKPGQSKRPLPPSRQNTNRSPPPKHNMHRSPPPQRLFGHSPTRPYSPPRPTRPRSPPGSPTTRPMPLGITITRLAQRPSLGRTASLPHTPNPYFRNYRPKSPPSQLVTSGSPSTLQTPKHIRGAVDIVIGLEKKRQKRKAKFWRQHCREYAKREAERKPIPGRGAERMKELGLECAERARGYGLAQQAQAVVSL